MKSRISKAVMVRTAGALFVSALLAAPVAAQDNSSNNGEGRRERRQRPAGQVDGQRPARGEGRGQRQRQEPVDLKTVEVKAPGHIIFTGKNAAHESAGTFTEWKFTKIDLPDNDYTKGSVELEINLASVTGNRGERLTNHLKSADFFNIEVNPKAKVSIGSATKIDGEEHSYETKAKITIGEVSTEVPLQFAVNPDNPREVKGEAVVKRTDLKVGEPPSEENRRSGDDEVKIMINAIIPEKVEDQKYEDAKPEAVEAAADKAEEKAEEKPAIAPN